MNLFIRYCYHFEKDLFEAEYKIKAPLKLYLQSIYTFLKDNSREWDKCDALAAMIPNFQRFIFEFSLFQGSNDTLKSILAREGQHCFCSKMCLPSLPFLYNFGFEAVAKGILSEF